GTPVAVASYFSPEGQPRWTRSFLLGTGEVSIGAFAAPDCSFVVAAWGVLPGLSTDRLFLDRLSRTGELLEERGWGSPAHRPPPPMALRPTPGGGFRVLAYVPPNERVVVHVGPDGAPRAAQRLVWNDPSTQSCAFTSLDVAADGSSYLAGPHFNSE